MAVSLTSAGHNVNRYSNPKHVCERARLRAKAHLMDPSIKLTALERAFVNAWRR